MMDEYIPSPRQTPNKPRRMRDVSASYPVDEKKLLLEALLKRQNETTVGEVSVGRSRGSAGSTGDASDSPRTRVPWREDRTCPVCRWTSTSPATSGSEYDGDESDDTSAGDYQPPETSSVSSDGSPEEDDIHPDGEEDSKTVNGLANGSNALGHREDTERADEIKIEDTAQKGDQPQDAPAANNDDGIPSLAPLQVTELADRPPERESIPSPGKLLYGRHCLWYQSAGFVRPQGGK